MAIVFLSLGANLGHRGQNIQKAIVDLELWGIKTLLSSSIYETEPIGKKDQPWFYNMAIKTETNFSAEEILKVISMIEKNFGRERKERFGPRPLDIDILFYENQIIKTEDLSIPHPRLQKRKFALIPLYEIAPDLEHPELKKSISQLLNECDDIAIVRRL